MDGLAGWDDGGSREFPSKYVTAARSRARCPSSTALKPKGVPSAAMLQRVFSLAERQTTVRREVLGGATTFATMAYIVMVNPAILAFAGNTSTGPSTVATIWWRCSARWAMALYANRPIAVAPYMGENAFIESASPPSECLLAAASLASCSWSGLLFLALHPAGRAHLARGGHLPQPEAQLRGRHRPLPRPHRPLRDRDRHERGCRHARGGALRPRRAPAAAGGAARRNSATCATRTCSSP